MALIRITAVFEDDGDYEALMEALSAAGLDGIEDEEDVPYEERKPHGTPKPKAGE